MVDNPLFLGFFVGGPNIQSRIFSEILSERDIIYCVDYVDIILNYDSKLQVKLYSQGHSKINIFKIYWPVETYLIYKLL